jgi:hypothetical protein
MCSVTVDLHAFMLVVSLKLLSFKERLGGIGAQGQPWTCPYEELSPFLIETLHGS